MGPCLCVVAPPEMEILPDLRAAERRQDRPGGVPTARSEGVERGLGVVVPVEELKSRDLLGQPVGAALGAQLAEVPQRVPMAAAIARRFSGRVQGNGNGLCISAAPRAFKRRQSPSGGVLCGE